MRLLYISPSVIPSKAANSVHVIRMCSAFASLGIQVELLYKNGGSHCTPNEIFDHYGTAETSIQLIPLVTYRKGKLNSVLYAFKTLIYCLRSNNRNIYSRNQLSSILILLLSFKKIFIELHAPPTGLYRKVFKLFINTKRINKVIVISEALKKIIVNDYKLDNSNKIMVAHDGADDVVIKSSNINFIKSNYDVGYVGHLYKGRGIEIILHLAKQNKKTRFHIIGGLAEDIATWKSKIESENVLFHGHVPPKLVGEYLSKFDLLVAPYNEEVIIPNGLNTASYMSPLKIFEYMSAKKPILTSDLPVLKEVLTHRVNSYLCNPRDFSEWNNALRLLKSSESLSKNIAERAYKDFHNFYTWSSRSKSIAKYFE